MTTSPVKNGTKIYEFIIESYQDRKALKENIMIIIDQEKKILLSAKN
jgi:hypothetical protein